MGKAAPRWFEVTIPYDSRSSVRESFLQDCRRCASECGVDGQDLVFDDGESRERYLVPPEVARAYFFHPFRSAIADWLLVTGMAKPCASEPDPAHLKRISG